LDHLFVIFHEVQEKPETAPHLRFARGRVPQLSSSQDTDMRLLAALLIFSVAAVASDSAVAQYRAPAQDPAPKQKVAKKRNLAALCLKPAFARANPNSCARIAGKKATAPAEQKKSHSINDRAM